MAKRKTPRPRTTRKTTTAPRTATTRKAAPRTRSAGALAPLRGRSGRAKEMTVEMGPEADAAARTTEERRESRPYVSRYPIDDDRFRQLKEAAGTAKLAKGDLTASADSGAKPEVSATGVALAAMDPSLEPSAAPSASTNFSGISATGWIPPDCTMAVGPAHVMLSVNSSVAIHNKVGGAAVLQRTLTQWFSNVVSGQTVFDPKLLYDQHAARWVLLAVAFKTNPNTSVFLLSVSATANPLGVWRNYVARRDEGRRDADGELGRLSGARRRRQRAVPHRQHVRVQRRLPVREDPRRAEGGTVLRRTGDLLRLREDEESGQQSGVHDPALSHLRCAAGRVSGELALPVRQCTHAVADHEPDRGARR